MKCKDCGAKPGVGCLSMPEVCTFPAAYGMIFAKDFIRLTNQCRSAQAFYEGALYEEAATALQGVLDMARSLKIVVTPCEHEWVVGPEGLACALCS